MKVLLKWEGIENASKFLKLLLAIIIHILSKVNKQCTHLNRGLAAS